MLTKYNQEVSEKTVVENLNRIGNQIFKLLPMREEDQDWIKPLETLVVELSGMSNLLPDQENLFSLVCKLEGLLKGGNEIEFMLFRRTIFETCSLVTKVKENVD